MDAFWLQDCPARGPALSHKHEDGCVVHPSDTCCNCSMTPFTATFAPMPPADIERRLNGDGPVRVTVEPKMRTGTYPGPASDIGRGPLSEGQRFYLSMVAATLPEHDR